jgi:raffinose/stachyose/melibiose transport system permease protein
MTTTDIIRTGTGRVRGRRLGVPFWFAVPALVFFVALVAYPTVQGIVYAFTDWSGLGSDIHFNGVDNFVGLFSDPQTAGALVNTLVMAVTITIAQNAIGLALALGVNSRIKTRNVLRTLLFAPVVMTPIIVGYLWQFLYVPNGPVASIAAALGWSNFNVLGDPSTAIWGVVSVVVWQYSGYSMVIFLAGMQNIPEEITEAAALDGAGAVKRFAYVTWPLLRTPTAINLTLSLITSLKLFDQVVATTQGGPGYATQTLSTLLYNEAFLYNRYGYGIALGLIVFALIAVVGFGQMRLFRDRSMR